MHSPTNLIWLWNSFVGTCCRMTIIVLGTAGRADGLSVWGCTGSLPGTCEFKCWVCTCHGWCLGSATGRYEWPSDVPDETAVHTMCNNSSGTQIYVSHNRLDTCLDSEVSKSVWNLRLSQYKVSQMTVFFWVYTKECEASSWFREKKNVSKRSFTCKYYMTRYWQHL